MASTPYEELDDSVWSAMLAKTAVLRACSAELLELHRMVELGRAATSGLLQQLHLDGGALAIEPDPDVLVAEAGKRFVDGIADRRGTGMCEADEEAMLERVADACTAALHSADPFAELFDLLSRRAKDLYGSSWPNSVGLSLEWSFDHPRPAVGDPYPIAAKTVRESAGPAIVVGFQSRPIITGLWPLVPRLLSHELICHVGAHDCGPANNESPFAEGLMDWASLYYLDRWLVHDVPTLARAAMRHAELAEPLLMPAQKSAPRLLGYRAAARLVGDQVHGAGVGVDAARARTARLAIHLNAEPVSLDAKDELTVEFATGAARALHPQLPGILAAAQPVRLLF